MNEHSGCKLECDYDYIILKFTQPVLIKTFKNEFDLPILNAPKTPAPAGDILMKVIPEEVTSEKDHKVYISVFGKVFHLVKWSGPKYLNRVRGI